MKAPRHAVLRRAARHTASQEAAHHPWRCLWRLFLQITLITPARFTMRQLLHILLTEALTFMFFFQIDCLKTLLDSSGIAPVEMNPCLPNADAHEAAWPLRTKAAPCPLALPVQLQLPKGCRASRGEGGTATARQNNMWMPEPQWSTPPSR